MSKITFMPAEECRALFARTLLHVESVDDLPLAAIRHALEDVGFCTLRGIATPDEIAVARATFRQRFSSEDHPGVGESPKDLQQNFQKLKAGMSPLAPTNSRLVRSFFNPMWSEDIFGLHDVFSRMIVVRNTLLDKPTPYASTEKEDGLWTASRLQHYPVGGGFMSAHVDELVVNAVSTAELEHVQLLLIITQKGVDYQRGGGFTIKDGQFIDVEQFCELGDVVVYDSRMPHGVDTIDPQVRLDIESADGRVVAFVTLYKDMA
jgi:hypothetical protein